MKKNLGFHLVKEDCDMGSLMELFKTGRIIYVADERNEYCGCIAYRERKQIEETRIMCINRHSKVVFSGPSEEEEVLKIFETYSNIRNIPIISKDNKILYEYILDFDDNGFDSRAYWEKRYKEGGNSGAGSYNRLAD